MAIGAYPLSWPAGWKRAAASGRKTATFGKVALNPGGTMAWKTKKSLSIADGILRIQTALKGMGVDSQDTIISTNVRTRLDGLPRSGEKEPEDPGVAVYWRTAYDAPMRCMAIDRYTTVANNLAAVGATLDAMRAIERHGGAEILDRAFTGFKALAAETAGASWWNTLGISPEATEPEIEAAFRQKARTAHPDTATGSADQMSLLNLARDQALSVARQRT